MTRVTALGAGAGTLFMLLFAFGGYEMYLMHGEIRQLQELAAASGSLSALIAEWSPVTPLIACHIGNEEWDGTGILEKRTDGEYYVLTAKHVITEGKRHASDCDVTFLDGTSYNVSYNNMSADVDGEDAITLKMPSDAYVTRTVGEKRRYECPTPPVVGDTVLVLGYPGNGASEGITSTQGIISGDEGDTFVTSAQINHGNSGGPAIDINQDCYIGTVIYGETDTNTLFRILKSQSIIFPVSMIAPRMQS